jgi:hypothetical protein
MLGSYRSSAISILHEDQTQLNRLFRKHHREKIVRTISYYLQIFFETFSDVVNT